MRGRCQGIRSCSPCYQGTLHHIFDGGWLWVIPFDNHPDFTNPLCSVGLQLDRRKYPDSKVSPEEEFQALLNRFPSMARQFEHARPVRDWVRSNARLQFSSRQVQGDGYILLPHAAGFIDPLFSSGLAITFNFIYNFAGHLIQAAREDDFSQHRFVHAESWMQNNIDHFDKLVSGAYDLWADFRLWNAWFRLWAIGTFFGTLGPIIVQMKYLQTVDARYLPLMEETPYRGVAGSDFSLFLPLLNAANEQMEAFRAGRIGAPEAADQIFALLAKADFLPPSQRFASPAARGTGPFTVPAQVRIYFWGRLRAPKLVRDFYFNGSLLTLVRMTIGLLLLEVRRSLRTVLGTTRDHVATWNSEWKHPRYNPVMPAKPIAHLTVNRSVAGPVPTVPRQEPVATRPITESVQGSGS